MQKVFKNSSQILSSNYNEKTKLLVVTFHSGGSYRYSDVPKDVADKWYNLPTEVSAGKWFNENIKGKYTTNRL